MKFFDSRLRMLRRMHYFRNMEGMYNRYLREHKGWDVHLGKTRKFIENFVNRQAEHQNLIVLGSGWLLDVPIEFLVEKYSIVYLADIVHPPQVKHKYRNYSPIRWVETDLTGGYLSSVYELVKQQGKTLSPESLFVLKPQPERTFQDLFGKTNRENPGSTHLISVNLLSQLDGMLTDYLQDHTHLKPGQILPFRRKIQQDHLDLLKNTGPACLITDFTEYRQPVKNGAAVETKLILPDWPDSPHKEQWKWGFDSSGSYLEDYTVSMLVRAICI
ncbi:MAG: hypothetical protein U0T82_15755 [Bacteroidales bacterium]